MHYLYSVITAHCLTYPHGLFPPQAYTPAAHEQPLPYDVRVLDPTGITVCHIYTVIFVYGYCDRNIIGLIILITAHRRHNIIVVIVINNNSNHNK